MRVVALVRFRLRGALTVRVLAAPLVTLALLQLVGLAGGRQPAATAMVVAVCLVLPVVAWLTRQLLDAEPDDQVLLSGLAVGGPVRNVLAGLLAALAVAVPLSVLCAEAALRQAGSDGVPGGVLLWGTLLAVVTAAAGVGVGALAARSVAGKGLAPVLVLVAAPVLVAVLGLAHSPLLTALVPRLGTALRASNPPDHREIAANASFVAAAPAVVAQVLLWALVVLGLRLLLARKR